MVNINIELPKELHKKLKIACAMHGISIKDFIINAMSDSAKKKKQQESER